MGDHGGLLTPCKYGLTWAELFGPRRNDNERRAFRKRIEKRRAKKKRKR